MERKGLQENKRFSIKETKCSKSENIARNQHLSF